MTSFVAGCILIKPTCVYNHLGIVHRLFSPQSSPRRSTVESWPSLSHSCKRTSVIACSSRMVCQPIWPATLVFLDEFFGKWLALWLVWPPWSLEMTLSDYFLWGHLKNTIYEHDPPATLEEVRVRIMKEITQISPAKLCQVFHNPVRYVQLYRDAQGGHFQHLS